MRPAAEFFSSQPASPDAVKSLDVFGNDLGEVDVWGDEKTDESPNTSKPSNYVANVLQQAIVITQQGPGNEKGEGQKPPRPAPLRELRAELMQKHGTILNSSMRRIRRASSDQSAGATKSIIADTPRAPSMSHPHLPPMTPRTRCRKMGIPMVPALPPVDPTPVVKTLSVAEKRRMRNGELLSTNGKPMSNQMNNPSQELFIPDWNLETKDNVQAQNQKKALLAEIKTAENKVRHRRASSDGQGAFHTGRLPWGTGEPTEVPSFEGSQDQGQRDTKLGGSERTTSHRNSCREKGIDHPRIKATQRSHSLSRKLEVSRTLSRRKPIDSPKSPRRRTVDLQSSTVELQTNLKNLFGDDPVSSPTSSLKNSAHSGKSISSKSDTSKGRKESENVVSDSVANKVRDEMEVRRSGSLPRRAGRRERRNSLTNTSDELHGKIPQKATSLPKAGQKIKFVRNSSFNDASKAECSQSATNSSSAKSLGGSSASKSRRFGRRASLGENVSCGNSTSSSRRHASACPPSPMRSRLENEETATGAPQSPGVRRNTVSSRRRSLVKGVAHDTNEVAAPSSTGASRRKIRYLKKSEGDLECDLPSISLDSED